jgi:tetratricopeptide (TPR) repeat protein
VSVLVTTLRASLEAADRVLDDGRVGAARASYIDLLERAQDRSDASMEVMARSMLALCLLRVRDLGGAEGQLEAAERRLDVGSVEAQARFRGAEARVWLEREERQDVVPRLRDYLAWAQAAGAAEAVLDACVLLADRLPLEARVDCLQLGVEHAVDHGVERGLGRAYGLLGLTLDLQGEQAEALQAWLRAVECHESAARVRPRVGAAWAVGELACRLEDWPLARESLEAALALAEPSQDCSDLEPLILGDLAGVYEAAGDVIEARRLILRALGRAREQELHVFAPARHTRLRDVARKLDLDV